MSTGAHVQVRQAARKGIDECLLSGDEHDQHHQGGQVMLGGANVGNI
jgi:hypothetical protein